VINEERACTYTITVVGGDGDLAVLFGEGDVETGLDDTIAVADMGI
jgi:hypothetical protein